MNTTVTVLSAGPGDQTPAVAVILMLFTASAIALEPVQ